MRVGVFGACGARACVSLVFRCWFCFFVFGARGARQHFSLYNFIQILFITIQQFIHFNSTNSYFFSIYIENHTFNPVVTQRVAHKKTKTFAEESAMRQVRWCDRQVCAPSDKLDFKSWPSQNWLGRPPYFTFIKFADKLKIAFCQSFKRL